jgi:hypothetical protein
MSVVQLTANTMAVYISLWYSPVTTTETPELTYLPYIETDMQKENVCNVRGTRI